MPRLRWPALIIAVMLVPIWFSGCNDKNKDTAINVKIEEQFGIDFSRPEYLENQNDPPPKIAQEIESWTPIAKEVAELFDQGDQEGALRLLYQDILDTNPQKEDQLFFSINSNPWAYLFHDPELVFRLYRDNDRTELSEDEKAACDMMVALAYDMGSFRGSTEETFYPEGTDEQRSRYEEYVEKREMIAYETYKKISNRYPQSNISALAKLKMARFYSSDEDEKSLQAMGDEIARDYPNSTYQTCISANLGAFYYNRANATHDEEEEGYVKQALQLNERILQLPNILYASTSYEHGSAHDWAERNIEELQRRAERNF